MRLSPRPVLTDEQRVERLSRPRRRPVRMVLDTDTYNEIDDQFALAHGLLAPDLVHLEAVYAAPFANGRSAGPGDGMRRSREEAARIVALGPQPGPPVTEGATEWLTATGSPVATAATADLLERATGAGDDLLYVVAIGAPTNVAAALMLEPALAERIVVVWLGGNATWWPTASEFNLAQDPAASHVLLDSGVPLVHVPCMGAADRLLTVRDEIDRHVRPAGPLGKLLAERYADFVADEPGRSKVIWDLAATAWVLEPAWETTVLGPAPRLTADLTWSSDPRRHLMAQVAAVDRDAVFGDLFARLAGWAGGA